MPDDQQNIVQQRYRAMSTDELVGHLEMELPSAELEAIKLLLEERSISLKEQKQIAKKILMTGKPYGVGGWLGFLVIGMMFLFPLISAIRINEAFIDAEFKHPNLITAAEWATYKSANWWTFLVSAGLYFYGGLGLADGIEWQAVTRAKYILWICGPITSITINWIIPSVFFSMDVPFGIVLTGLFPPLFWTLIWTVYLSKSERVRNTYG